MLNGSEVFSKVRIRSYIMYYIQSKGKTYGPLDVEKISLLFEEKKINDQTLVSTDNQTWLKLSEMKGLYKKITQALPDDSLIIKSSKMNSNHKKPDHLFSRSLLVLAFMTLISTNIWGLIILNNNKKQQVTVLEQRPDPKINLKTNQPNQEPSIKEPQDIKEPIKKAPVTYSFKANPKNWEIPKQRFLLDAEINAYLKLVPNYIQDTTFSSGRSSRRIEFGGNEVLTERNSGQSNRAEVAAAAAEEKLIQSDLSRKLWNSGGLIVNTEGDFGKDITPGNIEVKRGGLRPPTMPIDDNPWISISLNKASGSFTQFKEYSATVFYTTGRQLKVKGIASFGDMSVLEVNIPIKDFANFSELRVVVDD